MDGRVGQAIERFASGLESALGGPSSAVLYGSAARGEHVAEFSDVNILLVVDSLAAEALGRIRTALEPLRGVSRVPPLIVTHAEWRRSADVFPIEITDIQTAHRPLVGPDPLAGLVVAPADLRRALERELRGKLLRLRQAHLVLGDDERALGANLVRSVGVVGVLLRATLVLAGRTAPIPTPAALTAAGALIGFDPAPVEAIFAARGPAPPPVPRSRAAGYLAAVEAAVQFIDQFHLGGRS